MSAFRELRESQDYQTFLTVSARLGAEPLQVQAGGGNTSIKQDGAMWIKASGKWLAAANDQDIMVPVRSGDLLAALAGDDAAAEQARDFVSQDLNPGGLRPSIETTVHAVFPHRVVLHTHCVATIALAIRADAEQQVMQRLEGMAAVFVPYRKPGVVLAAEINARLRSDTSIIVLGNHGLVAGGETPEAAEAVLREASRRLAPDQVASGQSADDLGTADYEAAAAGFLHAIARDDMRLSQVAAGSYYPDHVIFLGPGVAVAQKNETVEAAAARIGAATGTPPPLLFLPGRGAVIRRQATAAERALAGCLADVFARVDPGAPLVTLSAEDESELLDWDAEKYRRALDAQQRSA